MVCSIKLCPPDCPCMMQEAGEQAMKVREVFHFVIFWFFKAQTDTSRK